MKVNLKLFLPALPDVLGRKEMELEFPGNTVGDLIEHLVTRYGRAAERALLDDAGGLDPVVQVLVNGEEWVTGQGLEKPLRDGDQVVLLMMMAGG